MLSGEVIRTAAYGQQLVRQKVLDMWQAKVLTGTHTLHDQNMWTRARRISLYKIMGINIESVPPLLL